VDRKPARWVTSRMRSVLACSIGNQRIKRAARGGQQLGDRAVSRRGFSLRPRSLQPGGPCSIGGNRGSRTPVGALPQNTASPATTCRAGGGLAHGADHPAGRVRCGDLPGLDLCVVCSSAANGTLALPRPCTLRLLPNRQTVECFPCRFQCAGGAGEACAIPRRRAVLPLDGDHGQLPIKCGRRPLRPRRIPARMRPLCCLIELVAAARK